jgi:cyclophilin family peptidyl-prolyl cis-trans isomerase/HEAT repeat protein
MLLLTRKVHLPLCRYLSVAILALGWFAILFSSCQNQKEAVNCFSDTVLVTIADYQDRRLADSLYSLGGEPSLVAERNALLAFASIQDTTAREYLEGVLHVSDRELNVAAAFALSQMGDGSEKFLKDLHTGVAGTTEGYLYLGKFLIGAGFHLPDSIHFETVPWAYYRYGLMAKTDHVAAITVARYLADSSEYARLGATHFFARSNALDSLPVTIKTGIAKEIIEVASQDRPEVRMAAVFALRKVNDDATLAFLSERAKTDTDYRVRVNAIRALQRFPFKQVHETLALALKDENMNVGVAASEVILSTVTEPYWKEIWTTAKRTAHWRIKANLYEAALKASDHKELAEEIVKAVQTARNPYEKAALITALQQSIMSFGAIQQELMTTDTPVVKTAAASALVALNYRKNFQPSLKPRFADLYRNAILQGDPGVIGIVAAALADSTLGYRDVIADFSFLKNAREKLLLPRDGDAVQSLAAALAYFGKRKLSPPAGPAFNHPIDWKLVKSIPADQQVLIRTSKGEIVIRLFVEETPGTVANFVTLVGKGYFNNKFFHRVVPNFVVQAGCPRGDGWGGENYTIRSEFTPRRFTTGSVGMASSGKDTEGTQWFITHSPTPHLEGRYTNFAEVVEGMEIVHQLEVGDKILEVRLK